MRIKIWERYFFWETLKIFFLFITCFYGLYVMIDYASHTSSIAGHHTQVHWKDLFEYYSFIFSSQAEILIPIALLIAIVKMLTQLNTRNELVALMAGGIKIKSILMPFLFIGILFTALLYFNEEYLLPKAMKKLHQIEDARKNEKHANLAMDAVKSIVLEDGTPLIYQSYDTSKDMFYDVYWINTIDDVYRMKYLSPYKEIPEGLFVDHLVRNKKGELIQKESLNAHSFPTMRFNSSKLHENLTPAEDFSISALIKKLPSHGKELSERESQIEASFAWKFILPLLCLLVVIAPAPFCVRFSRTLPVFFIYVVSIFGLLAFYLLLDALFILAKRQVVSPYIAVWIPFGLVFGYFSYRFYKLK